MTRSRKGTARPPRWRWTTVGFNLGAAAVIGLGCRSTEQPDPLPPPYTGLYPGLKAAGPVDPAVLATTPAGALLEGPATARPVPARPSLAGQAADPYEATCPGLRPAGPVPYPVAAAAQGRPLAADRPAGPVPYSVAATAAAQGRPLAADRPAESEPAADIKARVRPAAVAEPADKPGKPALPADGTKAMPVGPADPAPVNTLDLEIALRLAGVENPTINLARERIREALAGLLAARSLLLPSVNIGGNYHYHEGPLQASYGQIRFVDSQSLYLGFGARTLAAESVAFPGVRLFAHLGDAWFEPLAARQEVSARRFDARATQNTILLDVSTAYLQLTGAEARLEVLRRGETEAGQVLKLTEDFAQAGQRRQADARRAAAFEKLIQRDTQRAEEEVAVASARLCRLLNLDPSVRVRTPGGAIELFRLVPEDCAIDQLVADALAARPEVFARRAEVAEAHIRVRQEKVRPFVPLLSVGYSGGLFGGGSNLVSSFFGPMNGRSDFDVMAVWNVQNLGFGNLAQFRRTSAVVGETTAELGSTVNQVRQQVTSAVAESRAAARQVEIARASLANAVEGYGLEIERMRNRAEARPIELLDSFRQLLEAREAFVAAVIAYDVSQFRLLVALGVDPLVRPATPAPVPNPVDIPPPPGPKKQP